MASSAKYDEEEKRDKIVRLEDIMGDIYAMKFGKKGDAKTSLGKKRTYQEMLGVSSKTNKSEIGGTTKTHDQ